MEPNLAVDRQAEGLDVLTRTTITDPHQFFLITSTSSSLPSEPHVGDIVSESRTPKILLVSSGYTFCGMICVSFGDSRDVTL